MHLVQDLYQVILHGFVEDPAKPGFILLSPASNNYVNSSLEGAFGIE
jgi:hypothetical protein